MPCGISLAMQERQAIEWACRSCIIITSATSTLEAMVHASTRGAIFQYGRPPSRGCGGGDARTMGHDSAAPRGPWGEGAKRGPAGLQRGSPAGRKGGGDLLSRARGAVPSARAGLTALFGMGRGGAPPLWPPGRAGDARARIDVDDDGRHRGRGAALSGRGGGSAPRRRGKPLGPLVPVGSGLAAAAPPAYPRGRLPRPSGEASSRGGLRA